MTSSFPTFGVGVVVIRRGKILLGLRRGGAGAGTWSLPGGRIGALEELETTAARELEEETGLRAVSPPRPVALCNVVEPRSHFHSLTIGTVADRYEGELRLREPQKFVEWQWLNSVEPTRLFPPSRAVLAVCWREESASYGHGPLGRWLESLPPPIAGRDFALCPSSGPRASR